MNRSLVDPRKTLSNKATLFHHNLKQKTNKILLIDEFNYLTTVYFNKHANMTNSSDGKTIFVLTNSHQKDKK